MFSQSLSIVVPIYNVQDYLPECLDSIYSQECPNLEVILVNDGSVDDSLQVAKKYAARYENSILIDQPNRGLSSARNAGIKVASGDFIMFVDGDDFIEEGICRELVKVIGQTGSDIVVYGLKFFDSKQGVRKQWELSTLNSGHVYLRKSTSASRFTPTVCNKVFRRELIESLEFPVGLRYEDVFFSLSAILRARKVSTFLEKNYYYRTGRAESITQNISIDNYFELKKIIGKTLHFNRRFLRQNLKKQVRFEFCRRINNEILMKCMEPGVVSDYVGVLRILAEDRYFRLLSKNYIFDHEFDKHVLLSCLFKVFGRFFFVFQYAVSLKRTLSKLKM